MRHVLFVVLGAFIGISGAILSIFLGIEPDKARWLFLWLMGTTILVTVLIDAMHS